MKGQSSTSTFYIINSKYSLGYRKVKSFQVILRNTFKYAAWKTKIENANRVLEVISAEMGQQAEIWQVELGPIHGQDMKRTKEQY